jgi:predicted nucleic acid-binding protein
VPVAHFLVDVSAWTRYPLAPAAAQLDELGAAGLLATCGIVELQLLSGLDNAGTYDTVTKLRRQAYPTLDLREADAQRALTVQALLLADQQQSVPWPVLLVAAIAERHAVTVLHGSRCFDLVARITGQAVERIVAPQVEQLESRES